MEQWDLMRIRKQNNETQSDVAKVLDISESSYRNKELGRTQFKMEEMFIIARHYNKSIEEIFLPMNFTVRESREMV